MTDLSPMQVLAGVLTAVASVVGAIVAARFSSKASRESTKVAAGRAHTEDWEAIRRALRDELNEVREDHAEDRARIDTLEGKVHALEEQLGAAQRLFRAAQTYVERLLDFIADHLPGVEVPPPPADLTDHLPDSAVDDWRTPPPREDA